MAEVEWRAKPATNPSHTRGRKRKSWATTALARPSELRVCLQSWAPAPRKLQHSPEDPGTGQPRSSPRLGWPGLLPKPAGQQFSPTSLPSFTSLCRRQQSFGFSFVPHKTHLRHSFITKTSWALSHPSQEFAGSLL